MRKNKAIAIIAAICAVSIAGGVVGYTVGQRSEYMTIGAPHATPSEMPEGVTVGAVGAITVPGYERMSFKAGQKEQPVTLYNPAGNDCAFIVSVVLPSGNEIYRSNELLPGESIDAIEISDPLDPAIYRDMVCRLSSLF